ncbi:NUDIX hydrolase [Labilibaculum manganireducens]|uniref:ADP-ribose pyrophosphatase n=1 Tax=Labilibaculum manganireducens TaxID=1940525 RepID=A0A2N3IDL1_9BACT|nr:NUDIX hydrolase [Labilibaculum manganireducens]PKQ68422.1 ADP-ribose pyrophosphatase [Labilibaculum manganireducens]
MAKKTPDHWLTIAKKINSIAQSGLAFTKDKYDKERYEELRDLSIQIFNNITEIDSEKLEFVFNRDVGYQTPKVGVRAMIFKNDKILLVKEIMDNKWSPPGGYADNGMLPSEIAINEVKEESGFDVKPIRILGLIDYNKHQNRPFPFDIYQLFMECEIVGGEAKTGLETSDVGFFDINDLPELSVRRVTKDQILKMYELYKNHNLQPIFD